MYIMCTDGRSFVGKQIRSELLHGRPWRSVYPYMTIKSHTHILKAKSLGILTMLKNLVIEKEIELVGFATVLSFPPAASFCLLTLIFCAHTPFYPNVYVSQMKAAVE